jgi:hypothetical protein
MGADPHPFDEYFEIQSKAGQAFNPFVDGKPGVLADGKTHVSFSSINRGGDYELKWGAEAYDLFFWPHHDGSIEFIPGPSGSDFILLRGGDGYGIALKGEERFVQTIALDLPFGVVLAQTEEPRR